MLSPRTKIIILITGAVVIFGLIVATIFNLWPQRGGSPSQTGQAPETSVDLSFLEQPLPPVQGQEFDASNPEAFNRTIGAGSSGQTVSPLEQEARSLAVFFTEWFGTYSSDAKFANIDDLQLFMTPTMQKWSQKYKQSQPASKDYLAVITEVASLETKAFSLPERKAAFDVVANRTENRAGQEEQYQQKAVIDLSQNSAGTWLVASLYWGERL